MRAAAAAAAVVTTLVTGTGAQVHVQGVALRSAAAPASRLNTESLEKDVNVKGEQEQARGGRAAVRAQAVNAHRRPHYATEVAWQANRRAGDASLQAPRAKKTDADPDPLLHCSASASASPLTSTNATRELCQFEARARYVLESFVSAVVSV